MNDARGALELPDLTFFSTKKEDDYEIGMPTLKWRNVGVPCFNGSRSLRRWRLSNDPRFSSANLTGRSSADRLPSGA
jgi:hypothetical protein